MSSYENKFRLYGSSNHQNEQGNPQPSSSFGSRPSNSLARLAFNIYGSNSASSNSQLAAGRSSGSPTRKDTFYSSSLAQSHRFVSNSPARDDQDLIRTRYKANYELTSLDIIHTENREMAVIAGKSSLQTFNLKENVVVEDLLTSTYALKNKKQLGSILEVSTGYGSSSKYVAASTTTGSILVFDSESSKNKNKLYYRLSDHSRAVNTVEFSQLDHHLLLSGSQDGAMKLWDLRRNLTKPILTIYGNSDAVRSLKFSPFHNKKFAAIFDSGVIQKWDFRQPSQFEKKFNAHTGPGLTLDWHPELDYILSGGRDKQLQIWNMNSNDTRQVPDHVIYTAYPISKACFKPTVNSITNIVHAKVAACFLNNDLSVQIYSLKRKYIPLYTIESHSSKITGLKFLNETTLLTCSKDKYLIKDELTNYTPIIDDLSRSSITWNAENQLLYVNQSLENQLITDDSYYLSSPNLQNTAISTSPNSNLMMTSNLSSMTSNPPLMTPNLSMASSNFGESSVSPRPGFSRSSTGFSKPPMSKQGSGNLRHLQSHYYSHRNGQPVINPYAVPVELPINRSRGVLEYLVDNYVLSHDEKSFIEVCDSNYEIAYTSANYRDAQTWKVIKEGLIWESNSEMKLKYDEDDTIEQIYDENQASQPKSAQEMGAKDFSSDQNYNNYSTSNSTNYGKSPSLSDLSDFNNSVPSSAPQRPPSFSSSYKISNLKQSILRDNKSDIALDTPLIEEEDDPDSALTKDDTLKWDVDCKKLRTSDSPEKRPAGALPIENAKITRSPSMGLSSSVGGRSASPVFSITSTMSNASQSLFKPISHRNAVSNQSQTLRPSRSGMSELTRQLTNQRISDEIKIDDSKSPPFSPRLLIQKAVDFSVGQGDLVTSCTLLLIFNSHYKIKHSIAFKEIIYSYLLYLLRLRFFVHFTKVSQFLNEYYSDLDIDLTTVSKTSSVVRHFCSNCGKLIVNEDTKAKMQSNNKSELVGTWFCELCQERNKCIYCNEILKGLSLVRLKCGHNGHFGCLKNWFLEMGMEVCPSGCL